MTRSLARRGLLVAVSSALAVATALVMIEAWVRVRWDDRQGRPGFYLSDPVLGQRLAPGYDGWFGGVPVRINALGFRDPRDYRLEKPANTFRVLVLGDSVTFGHGAEYETTYPYLLELRLRTWQPDVNWEVWNLGVPGYNTRQELDYLHELGPRADPDLVVVGFYANDFDGNEPVPPPSWSRRLVSAAQRVMQRHLYSFEFYKRVSLTLRWRLLSEVETARRIEHLATEQALLAPDTTTEVPGLQRLTEPETFDEAAIRAFVCPGVPGPDPRGAAEWRARLQDSASDLAHWLEAVRGFQAIHRAGLYPIVFFINLAPEVCPGEDRFYDGGMLAFDDTLLEVLGRDTPAVSTARAFLHYRPSQVPGASAHAFGNANRVKADVLFAFLRDGGLLPSQPPEAPVATQPGSR